MWDFSRNVASHNIQLVVLKSTLSMIAQPQSAPNKAKMNSTNCIIYRPNPTIKRRTPLFSFHYHRQINRLAVHLLLNALFPFVVHTSLFWLIDFKLVTISIHGELSCERQKRLPLWLDVNYK